jgi:hypothetical protein
MVGSGCPSAPLAWGLTRAGPREGELGAPKVAGLDWKRYQSQRSVQPGPVSKLGCTGRALQLAGGEELCALLLVVVGWHPVQVTLGPAPVEGGL